MESNQIQALTEHTYDCLSDKEKSQLQLRSKSCAGVATLSDLKDRIVNLVHLNVLEGVGTKLQTLNVLFRRGATTCETSVTSVVDQLVGEDRLVLYTDKCTVCVTPHYVTEREKTYETCGISPGDKVAAHKLWMREAR